MSTEVERKVVDMQFNNRQFERNVNQSISSLDKLKSSLNFNGMGKGLEEVDRAASKVDFSPLVAGVDTVTNKFSFMNTALTTVAVDITRTIEAEVKKWGTALTTANIDAGWDKYAEKTKSVQTIMAATAKDFADQGEQMEYVNEQVKRLNWFTDETSYNLVDMTSNIGKFTANNVPLETAVTAMEGIATAAALAGAGTAEASRVMYNFSQALGTGSVQLRDWMSIENANMATAEFKETIIETAAEMGVLTEKNGKYYINAEALSSATGESAEGLKQYMAGLDGVASTADGIEVSIENFRETLAQDWFTSDVLTASLEKYGKFSDEISKFYMYMEDSEGAEYTTSELVKEVNKYKNALGDQAKEQEIVNDLSEKTGLDSKKIAEYLKTLSSEEYDLGRKAFAAAQEAKTFQEAIDSVKDAASTKWSGIFEAIFGDYLTAKEVWTGLANYMYDMFVQPIANVLEVANKWKVAMSGIMDVTEDGVEYEMNYQQVLMKSFANIGEAIVKIKDAITDAFKQIFGSLDVDGLANFTKKFYDLSQKLIISDDAAERLTNTLVKIFTVIKKVFNVVKIVFNAAWKIVSTVAPYIYDFIITISDGIETLSKTMKGLAQDSGLSDYISGLGDSLKSVGGGAFSAILDGIAHGFELLKNAISSIDWVGVADKIWNALTKIGEVLKSMWEIVKPILKDMATFLTWVLQKIKDAIDKLKDKISKGEISEDLKILWQNLKVVLGALIKLGGAFLSHLAEFVSSKTFSNLLDLVKTVTGVTLVGWLMRGGPLYSLLETLEDISDKFAVAAKAKAMKDMATGLLLIAATMLIITRMDPEKVETATQTMIEWMLDLVAALSLMAILTGGKFKIGSAAVMLSMGTVLLTLVGVMAILSRFSENDMDRAFINLEKAIELLTLLLLTVGVFSMMTKRTKKDRGFMGATNALFAIVIAFALFAVVAKKIGEMDPTALENGLSVFERFMTATTLYMAILTNRSSAKIGKNKVSAKASSTPIMEAALALVIISGAMIIFSKALETIGSVDIDSAKSGVGLFLSMMIVFAIVSKIMSGKIDRQTSSFLDFSSNQGTEIFNGKSSQKSSSNFRSVSTPILETAAGIVLISGALWVFSKALQEMKNIDMGNAALGVLIFAGMMVVFGLVSKILSGKSGFESSLKLGSEAEGLSNINGGHAHRKDELESGSNATSMVYPILQLAAGVAVISGALWIFAKALQELEYLDAGTFWLGVASLTILLAATVLAMAAINAINSKTDGAKSDKFKNMAVLFLGMTILAASMYAIAKTFAILGDISDPKTFGRGMAVFGAVLAAMILMVPIINYASKGGSAGSKIGGLITIALGLVLIAGAMVGLMKITTLFGDEASWKKILALLGGMAAALLLMTGIALVMNKVKGTSIAKLFGTILALAVVLPIFVLALWGLFEVLKEAPELNAEQKETAWIAIVGLLVGIVGAIAAIVLAKTAINIVTSILLKLATAILVAAAAVWLMDEAMKTFSEISTETSGQLKNNIQNAMESFMDSICQVSESLGRALAAIGNAIIVFILSFFYEICDMIYEQTPNFIEAVTKLLDALDEIIVQCGYALVQLIVDIFGLLNSSWKKDLEPPLEEFFGNIIDFIGKLSPKLVEMVLGIVDDILEGAKTHLPTWLDDLGEMLFDVIDFVVDFLKDLGKMLTGELTDVDGTSNLKTAINGTVGNIWNLFEGAIDLTFKIGEKLGQVFNNAIGVVGDLMKAKDFGEFMDVIWDDMMFHLRNGWVSLLKTVQWLLGGSDSTIGKLLNDPIEKAEERMAKAAAELSPEMESLKRDMIDYYGLISKYEHAMHAKSEADQRAMARYKREFDSLSYSEKNVLESYINQLESGIAKGRIVGSAKSDAQTFINAWEAVLGVHSPSTVFKEIGEYCMLGLEKGVKKENGGVVDEAISLKDQISQIWNDMMGDQEFSLSLVIDDSALQDLKDEFKNSISGAINLSSTGNLSDFASSVGASFDFNKLSSISGPTSTTNTTDYNNYFSNTFNVTGTDATDIAGQISNILQGQTDRQSNVWSLSKR